LEFLPASRLVPSSGGPASSLPQAHIQKKPCADSAACGTERRARFSYDDLLELFSLITFYNNRPASVRDH